MSKVPLKPFPLAAGVATWLCLLSQPAAGQQAFTAVIEFDEYAFPQVSTDGGIVVQGPGGTTTEAYNLLDDVTGDELGADNGDLDDFVFTYTASPPADLTPANRPDLRFRESGAAGDQITGRTAYSLGAPNANNPGSRHFYELEVRFAEHVEMTELLLDFFSLNTSGIAWEFSSIVLLDQDGNPFSPLPDIPPHLDYEPGETGNVAPGVYLLALTGTVEGVGTDLTSSGTSNPPADGPILLSEADFGVAGQVIGGFIWRTTLEDVRGVENGSTTFTSSLREMTLSGTLVQQPGEADLLLSKEAAVEDTTAVFALDVTNNGPDDATAVAVTDELPECATYVSDDCDGEAGPPFLWELGDLASGASASCNVTVDASTCEGEQTNTATVAAEQTDPNPDDNSAEATFEIGEGGQGADLSVTQDATVHEGGTVDFEIEVANEGPEDASGVEVTDTLPECAAYVSDDCEGEEGPPFTWTIGALANGASTSCTMTAEASSCEGEQTVVAEVTADQADPDPDDNTAEAVFDIEVVPALPWLATVLLILLLGVIATRALRRSRA